MGSRPLPTPLRSGSFEVPTELDGTYVYRAYCRCGDLLYVGITNDIFTRMTAHRRTRAEWELKMIRLEWDHYRTRRDAARVEQRLIATLYPLYNTVHAVKRSRPVPLPWPRALTEPELHRCAIAAYRGRSYLEWLFSEDGVAA